MCRVSFLSGFWFLDWWELGVNRLTMPGMWFCKNSHQNEGRKGWGHLFPSPEALWQLSWEAERPCALDTNQICMKTSRGLFYCDLICDPNVFSWSEPPVEFFGTSWILWGLPYLWSWKSFLLFFFPFCSFRCPVPITRFCQAGCRAPVISPHPYTCPLMHSVWERFC